VHDCVLALDAVDEGDPSGADTVPRLLDRHYGEPAAWRR
jgi:hypothetical protein